MTTLRKIAAMLIDITSLFVGSAMLILGLWALVVCAMLATTSAVLPGALYASVGFMILVLRGLRKEGLI